MIPFQQRIIAFSKLGKAISAVADEKYPFEMLNKTQQKLRNEINEAYYYNGWFDKYNVLNMVNAISHQLTETNLNKWLQPYGSNLEKSNAHSTIAVIMAGNIPLVGFHDFLSVLMSGNNILAKLSGDDNRLLPSFAEVLFNVEPEFEKHIRLTSEKIEHFDAIIATGSDNTGRYFEYYFGKYPNIIRKNRSGIAVITGSETDEDLQGICDDIHQYYGLGCRNVSHLSFQKAMIFINS